MASEYDIELAEPSTARCDCCGGLSVRLTRFVTRDGDAFAIYYVAYANNHATNELAVLLSLGDWGEDAPPDRRVAFYCRVRPSDDSYEMMFGDAAESAWGDVELVGAKLSRQEALAHRWKDTACELLDEAFAQDPSLQAFLMRAQCGDVAVPLERNFQAPDDIWSLEVRDRAEVGDGFAVLDGSRWFVRCLLSIPVEEYGSWSVGLWVEVSQTDHARARRVWNDPSYHQLRFAGTVANDLTGLDLPVPAGTEVQVAVTDPQSPPTIVAATGDLAALLSQPWARDDFEQYAIKHSFL